MIELLVWLWWTAVYIFFTFLGLMWLYRLYDCNNKNYDGSKTRSRMPLSWLGWVIDYIMRMEIDRYGSQDRAVKHMDDMDRNVNRSRDSNMERSRDRNMESSRDRNMNRSRDRNMDSSRERNMERSRERNMDRSRDRNMDRSRDRNMDRSRDRNMERSLDRNLDRSRDRNMDRSKDRNLDRSRDRNMDRSNDRNMDRSKDRAMESSRDRNMESSRNRAMERAVEKNMENMDRMDRIKAMNQMQKLHCMDLDRMDRTPLVRSRSNSIHRVQSDSEGHCKEEGYRNRSNSMNLIQQESQAEEEHNTSSMGGFSFKKMLHGKTVIVTNGHKGIGYETSKDLARRGARVIIGCRNRDRGMTAARKIIDQTGNKNVTVMILDLGSLQSVREFAREVNSTLDKVDILVNYSGSGNLMIDQRMSQDGYDMTLQTNHFAHFLLTNLIKETMDRSDERRIINVSSLAARECMDFGVKIDYDAIVKGRPFATDNWNEHTSATSKFMNCLFSAEIPRRWKGYKSYSLHPGIVRPDIFNKMNTPTNWKFVPLVRGVMNVALVYGQTPRQGAECAIFCCLDDNLEKGKFFSDLRNAFDNHTREQNYKKGAWYTRNYEITDPQLGRELWDFSARLVEL